MKIIFFGLLLIFISMKIFANEKWIKIENINKPQVSKQSTKLDVNLSQIEPINKMTKNIKVIKELIDATSKKNKPISNDKDWFVLHAEDTQ